MRCLDRAVLPAAGTRSRGIIGLPALGPLSRERGSRAPPGTRQHERRIVDHRDMPS